MRTLLTGTVIVALLGGLNGAVMAQDQQGTATRVTGASPGGRTVSEGTSTHVDGMSEVRDAVYEHTIEWSDPRLPSLMRVTENLDWRPRGDGLGAVIVTVSNVRLEGSEGAWTGLEYGLIEQLDPGDGVTRLMFLNGEGAYEGLSAMLARTYESSGDYAKPIFDGYIFDGATAPVPSAPDPFGQSDEGGLEVGRDDQDVASEATGNDESSAEAATGDDDATPVWVTGTVRLAPCSGMTSTSNASVQHERGYVCGPQAWTASDARLTGTGTLTWNADVYESGEGTVSVSAGTYDVRNESGGWLCHYADGVAHGSGMFSTMDNEPTLTCAGNGANEGLSAMLILDWTNGPPNLPLSGLIFTGDAPPLPVLSAE